MHNGFIALHRKTLNSSIFDNPHLFKMWAWCLLKATHTEHKQLVGLEEITLRKGQFVTGRIAGAKELKITESMWYRHLKQLEKMDMILINSNNKYTVVTIVKWELYQVDKPKANNKRTTNEQQMNTNNNDNNVNNKECAFDDEFIKEILSLYRGRKSKSTRDKKVPKLLKTHSKNELLKAIRNYNSTLKEGQTDFILNEATFWNTRYIDFLDENFSEQEPTKSYTIGSDRLL